ncbi:hypothetical protein FE257_001998 [Aspergillus nanangensis]|uniref:LysM domain protein n=1 Tax=Aspergillus nanangensis TaxID=2582783 RepID=A0AAD4CTJ4_ASPNN|nr:hypothetical protein FE257_001998 [Aspergillus nanangensis]
MSSSSGLLDALSPGTSTNTSQRSASTIRARPRRLVSFTDDDDDNNGNPVQSSGLSTMYSPELSAVRSRGNTPSPHPSRGVSPMPMRHPSRATESPVRGGVHNSSGGFKQKENNRLKSAESSRATVDFLDVSWSSLQSLASSVLGSDIARPATNGTTYTHIRKPSRPDSYMRAPARSSTATSWGPSAPSTPEIGAGTKEERQALVQAKKREALLLADTGPAWTQGPRHKRRDSSDRASQSNIDVIQDEEALAYIHHVQPTDSITGVTIRYGCQPAVFRRANGFWPSDSIQGRKTVLLPVDSCTVKGRPVQAERFLGAGNYTHNKHSSLEDLNGSSISPAPMSMPDPSTFPTDEASPGPTEEAEADRIWKHESYVQIDGFPNPVEIGRVPRRALGFFPRSRRKSVSYTDSETPSLSGRDRAETISPISSSIDRLSSQSTRPHADSSSSHASNSRPQARHQRQRSNIHLSGPGVGTLDRDTQIPGPALDGLSKFFAQHLPNFAPAPSAPNFQSTSEYASTATSNTTSLDNFGGAVEGWVRKMTTRAKSSFNDLQQGPANRQTNGLERMGRRGAGDLIELDDGLESRSSSGLLDAQWTPEFNQSAASLHGGGSLRERFPSPASGTSRTRAGGNRSKDD